MKICFCACPANGAACQWRAFSTDRSGAKISARASMAVVCRAYRAKIAAFLQYSKKAAISQKFNIFSPLL